MRPIAKIVLITGFASIAGCAAHAVRCDERLEAINAPRAKPARRGDAAPSADVAPPRADAVRSSEDLAPPATKSPSGP